MEEMSKQEKDVLCKIHDASPRLDYVTQKVACADGSFCEMYLIPPEERFEVFKQCWPFELGNITENSILVDIHSQQSVLVKELCVIRYKDRNIIVSPHYPETGGMAVDLIDIMQGPELLKSDPDKPVAVVSTIKRKKKSAPKFSEDEKWFLDSVRKICCMTDGTDHAWKELDNGLFITLEGASEKTEEGDIDIYACAYLTNEISSDGYCSGEVLADAYPDNGCTDLEVVDKYRYLLKQAEEIEEAKKEFNNEEH